ncbi:hypothetical protein [Flavilitoribacter nigricans]|uniref:Uncharacterized protein n=1 Tax=Flavilitoribacter nigricans (strain ATCC 23147 / DSM 23189 / NBRC 102662 / NCIMB 1420 / SS-2) TaxID=1122177 RepID=A0A2D0MXP3_FLAN2|nr:hypothetical protein [Flavilitoribacter nigricans]PHN00908.1 hypothetical protein CRP01_39915 [Flavilitoribacter nigricans DSM 23189 = NBRC 102662]
MIDRPITALLFVSNQEEADLIKQQVHKSASSTVVLTAFTVDDFKKKLAWFPTTFIVIRDQDMVDAAKNILEKYVSVHGEHAPLLVTSTDSRALTDLPFRLEALFDSTREFREQQELLRQQKLEEQRRTVLSRETGAQDPA